MTHLLTCLVGVPRHRLRADKQVVEQQLQVTSGNLLQVERSLASVASSTSSHASYRTSMSTWHAHHAADEDASPVRGAGMDAGAAAVDAVMLVRP